MVRKSRVIPPVYFLVSLLAMVALHYFLPIVQLVAKPVGFTGIGFLLAGLVIAVAAAGTFARAGTPVMPFTRPTVLVTSGLFRLTRNPMYLGMVIAQIGAALLLGSLAAFFPIPVFAWSIDTVFIRREEAFMEETFGDEYLDYKKRVRRWL